MRGKVFSPILGSALVTFLLCVSFFCDFIAILKILIVFFVMTSLFGVSKAFMLNAKAVYEGYKNENISWAVHFFHGINIFIMILLEWDFVAAFYGVVMLLLFFKRLLGWLVLRR